MAGDDGDRRHLRTAARCRSHIATTGCICRCRRARSRVRTWSSSITLPRRAGGRRLASAQDNIHGDRAAFSENWYNRARQWLPMIDHPADKATGELIVTTKADYQVVSNGVHRRAGGSARRTAAHALEAGRADLVVALLARHRPLHRAAGGRRSAACRSPSGRFRRTPTRDWRRSRRDARESFEFFSDRVGPCAHAKLAHVEAAGMGGGTEHVSNIFYGEKSVTAGNAPVVHETAHQWFGDSVTESDWNDVWLSEASRRYFTLLYTGARQAAAMRSPTASAAAATRCCGSRSRCRTRRSCTRTTSTEVADASRTIASCTRRARGRCTCCAT